MIPKRWPNKTSLVCILSFMAQSQSCLPRNPTREQANALLGTWQEPHPPIHTSLSLLTEDPTVDPEVDTCPSASLLNNLLEISHIYPGIRQDLCLPETLATFFPTMDLTADPETVSNLALTNHDCNSIGNPTGLGNRGEEQFTC